jgi:hypothetical protein
MGINSITEEMENIRIIKLKGRRFYYDHGQIILTLINELKKIDNIKVVIDLSELKGSRSITESIIRAESFPIKFRQIKMALLESESNRAAAVSEEFVFTNRGFCLKAFFDLRDSLNWLKMQKVG